MGIMENWGSNNSLSRNEYIDLTFCFTGAFSSPQTATEECCVEVIHMKAKDLVSLVFDICTGQHVGILFLETAYFRVFSLNSLIVYSYFTVYMISNVDT